jgi:hypothetical protein
MMERYYFVHNGGGFTSDDLAQIDQELNSAGFTQDLKAAVGEGAGGTGFEDWIEVVIGNPIAQGVLSAIIYDAAKRLVKFRPKKRALPVKMRQTCRLVVHIQIEKRSTIVGVDLMQELEDIKSALDKLEARLDNKPGRLYQNRDDWDEY